MNTLTVDVAIKGRPTLRTRVVGKTAIVRDAGGPAPLYIHRPVKREHATALAAWAKSVGLKKVLSPDDMHVTVAYSKTPVDWFEMPVGYNDSIVIPAGGPRRVEKFGGGDKKEVAVLRVRSNPLKCRWQELCDSGCSWSYPEYAPHITLASDTSDVDVDNIPAYAGELHLGPEIWEPVS